MFSFMKHTVPNMPSKKEALVGRITPTAVVEPHFVNGRPLTPPYPNGSKKAMFGLGCFWGAERLFWRNPGVYLTAAGYAGGYTKNPTYEEVCSGKTGHNEVVLVIYDPTKLNFTSLLRTFWEGHDPTQGMRQGNDVGTQYRSGIYCFSDQDRQDAEISRDAYDTKLKASNYPPITTEILLAPEFYFAETYHQQYLGRNPSGYCGLGGTGVVCG